MRLPATASDEVDHYAAIPSETLVEAMTNLAEYNAKVEEVMARALNTTRMPNRG